MLAVRLLVELKPQPAAARQMALRTSAAFSPTPAVKTIPAEAQVPGVGGAPLLGRGGERYPPPQILLATAVVAPE
jgi:hypothetical protein